MASFAVGDKVHKPSGDYTFRGHVVGVVTKLGGGTRYVVENPDGLLHIFNAAQLAAGWPQAADALSQPPSKQRTDTCPAQPPTTATSSPSCSSN